MKRPQNRWPTSEHAQKGLYFAQLAHMLLNEKGYESFRLQSLDLLTRLKEIEKISYEIANQNVSHRNIVDPCKELAETFKNDLVAQRLIGAESNHYLKFFFSIDDGKAKHHQVIAQSARYLNNILQNSYKSALENELILLFSDTKYYYKVFQNLSNYLALLVNKEYSRDYIRIKVDQHFFTEDVKRFDPRRLRAFFSEFDLLEREYEVWIPVYGAMNRLLGFVDKA